MASTEYSPPGATVVITHRVKPGHEADYDRWLTEIGPVSQAAEGNLDWQVIRPVPGLTTVFTVIIRFDTADNLRAWIESNRRRALIEKVRPHLEKDDDYTIHTGLEFLFMSPGARRTPVRWKQFLITWSVIFPLNVVMAPAVTPVLHHLGLPDNRLLVSLIASGLSVFLFLYVIMPRYARLVRGWLER